MSNLLAEKIRRARVSAQLTQAQLAERLGLTRGAVTQWESKDPDTRTTPSVELLRRLAEIVNVPLEWLLDQATTPDDIHFARARYLAAVRSGKPFIYKTEDNKTRLHRPRFHLGRWTESYPTSSEEQRLGALQQIVNAGKQADATAEEVAASQAAIDEMALVEHAVDVARTLERTMDQGERPGRMAQAFWKAVEFEVFSVNPVIEAAFDVPIPCPVMSMYADFYDGKVVAEFTSLPMYRHHRQWLVQKFGQLLMMEALVGHPLRKQLLIWAPGSATSATVEPQLLDLEQLGDAVKIEVHTFRQPSEAAKHLLSLV